MSSTRRRGVESSEVRARLIEAAMQLVRMEGYAAITTRRLAEMVGLKRHIVHYYFGTIEELFIAAIRQEGEKLREFLTEALESDEPLRLILESDYPFTVQVIEFAVMATRHKALQAEMSRSTEEFRRMHTAAVERYLKLKGIKPAVPPVAITMAVIGITRFLAEDKAMGASYGHAELRKLVETWIEDFASGKAPSLSGSRRRRSVPATG